MNRKAFTLAELIAVVVILGLIAVITVPEVTKVIRENRTNACGVQLENIKEGAKSYLANNLDKVPDSFDECYADQIELGRTDGEATTICTGIKKDVKISDLVKYGFVENKLVNPNTEEAFTDDYIVRITKDGNIIEYNIYQTSETGDTLITKEGFCK